MMAEPASSIGTKSGNQQLRSVESDHATAPSPLRTVLTQARTDLWAAHPIVFTGIFSPLRDFVFDPALAISCVLLPPLLNNAPNLDKLAAMALQYTLFLPIKAMYCHIPHKDPATSDRSLRGASRDAILRTGPNVGKVPKYQPPSDLRSAFQGGISFAVSAVGDIVGVMTNPRKMKKWVDALGQLKRFLHASGIGDELEEAMMKPMLRGRLLDNLKILNDWQETFDADRPQKAKLAVGGDAKDIKDEIREGHRLMRFATAAYGTEMIKSAIDVEVDPAELQSHKQAIAIHTGVEEDDIKYIYAKDDHDHHVLHHFAAVDRKSRNIVLALRGTLSLSGAIVDVQGMAMNFCLGMAHRGMAEMAEQVWEASGGEIKRLFAQDEYKDFGLIITGHSLGAGTSCLLNIKCHVDRLVGKRPVKCYAFAPPPTFHPCNPDATGDGKADPPVLVKKAIENTVAYIHDNDAVPFLSISSVRKLAALLDAVDNTTEYMWFYDRWAIFHEMKSIPQDIFDSVGNAAREEAAEVDGECRMSIPARIVVWMQKDEENRQFIGYGCNAADVSKNTVFISQDCLTDHLPEQYEDALDALLADQVDD
jgi:hypothetical protein